MEGRVTHVGSYRVERELSLEPLRTVYQGWQIALNRPVQITQLTPEGAADSALIARWKTAARDLRDPGHPQLPRILDAQFGIDQPYLVESYVIGDTLADRMGQPRDVRAAAKLIQPLEPSAAEVHFTVSVWPALPAAKVM